jgi:nitroimidazol reductase NimA-like FMN-containing flavoprotein (pyridoxamine 5'-phosphate oxidase superfamily)
MLIDHMSARQCHELLARTNVARLACAFNNQPYVVPIHVDYHSEFLYGFSMLGQKIEWMRANPLVCVEVDEVTSRRCWESVIVFGQYEELTDTPEHAAVRRDAEILFQRHPNWWQPATVPLGGHPPRPPILFRILISRMSGRRARPEDEERASMSAAPPTTGIGSWFRSIMRYPR